MKLRLPSLLLSAVVAAQMCTTANADTVVASGVSYDVGKVSQKYSGVTDTGYNDDVNHCWATAASNVIQNWQDKYSGNAVTDSLPNGVIASPAGSAEGTVNLDVYKTILANSGTASKTDDPRSAFEWWFKNEGTGTVLTEKRTDGDYYSDFGEESASIHVTSDPNAPNVIDKYFSGREIKTAFDKANGNAVAITIQQDGPYYPYDSRKHVVTCWGYETDDDGNVTALFLSDSDDKSYGLFKTSATFDSRLNAGLLVIEEGDLEKATEPGLHLDTDDKHDGYNGCFEVTVSCADMIDTPAAASLNAGASTTAATAPDADGKVTKNTTLTATTEISGKGVSVGSGKEGKLVMLTSENDTALNLIGKGAATSGLSVEKGSLASLDNVSISGYNGSGVELEGRGYLHDGTVSIKDNHATDGGAVKTSTYLEIEGNDKVEISGNSATNKGGGISNTGIVSIFGNKEVTFSGNTAAKGGNDIYNAEGGIVNIYNNDKVEFKSSDGGAAVRNEGELYVAAKEGKDVTFVNSSLDSRGGKTYVGTDLSGDATDSTGGLKFTNSEGTETLRFLAASEPVEPHTPELYMGCFLTGYAQRTPAVLENLSVSLNEINGVSADQSSISGAKVIASGDLTASKITLDNTSTIKADAITLNAVVIDLKDVASSTVDDIITYDLSGLLTASTGVTMNNLVFDTNSLELTEGQQVVVTLGNSLEGTARLLTAEGLRNQTTLADGSVFFSASSPIVPEPATTTLSLLALAGLCARRRRH